MKAQQILEKALKAHKSGKLTIAEKGYSKAVKLTPHHADAWHLYGVVALDANNPELASKRIRKALSLNSEKPEFYLNYGLTQAQQGQYKKAIESYQQAIQRRPNYALAFNHCGVSYRSLSNWQAALDAFNQALDITPSNPVFLHNKALTLNDSGMSDAAIAVWMSILKNHPATQHLQEALSQALAKNKQYKEACYYLEQTLILTPKNAELLYKLGEIRFHLGQFSDAATALSQATSLQPNNAAAWSLLGKCHLLEHKPFLALEPLEKARSLSPNSAAIEYDYGYTLLQLGEREDSCCIFRKVLAHSPNAQGVHDSLLMALSYSPDISTDELFKEHIEWARQFNSNSASASKAGLTKTSQQKLKIGYVSADLGQHAVSNMILDTLRAHNSEKFSIYYYSGRKKEDFVTEKFKKLAHKWYATGQMDDATLVETIKNDEIDILIDLSGHTSGNRLAVFAQKPAPVQASWIGYCDTTGLESIDYILMDPITAPPELDLFFSEEVFRFPVTRFCYSPPAYAPTVSTPPCISNGYITFGSFSNLLKVSPKVLQLWSEVLKNTENSKLIIFWSTLSHPPLAEKILSLFTDNGIEQERIILDHDHQGHAEMLGKYGNIDICLDTFPYSGGITTSEALWMGVPVITLLGERAVSRQSASILSSCGFSDWIATDETHYVKIASKLTLDSDELLRLRKKQRQQISDSAFMDYKQQAKHLEQLYLMWWGKLTFNSG